MKSAYFLPLFFATTPFKLVVKKNKECYQDLTNAIFAYILDTYKQTSKI